jgi:hypothetical protein
MKESSQEVERNVHNFGIYIFLHLHLKKVALLKHRSITDTKSQRT